MWGGGRGGKGGVGECGGVSSIVAPAGVPCTGRLVLFVLGHCGEITAGTHGDRGYLRGAEGRRLGGED